ncbi:MAG: hypothetical protein KC416_11690, partial [Myxococcales bacterium]|nr:hypothetical protein [Myxococcales bacterium]
MDLHLFRPAVDSKGFISANGTDILGANDISFALVLDAGFGILPFNGFEVNPQGAAADAKRVDRVVDVFGTGTLRFNYGIENLMVVGLQIPIQVVAGPNTSAPGVYNTVEDGLE